MDIFSPNEAVLFMAILLAWDDISGDIKVCVLWVYIFFFRLEDTYRYHHSSVQ